MDGWGCSAYARSANNFLKAGDADASTARLPDSALCALRGYGMFEIARGAGFYGAVFAECIWSIATDRADYLRFFTNQRKLKNRTSVGLSSLKFGW